MLQRRAGLVALLLVLALAARALMPTGYMAGTSDHGLTIELCSGVAGKTVTLALPGAPARQHDGKAEMAAPCAFAGGGFDQASLVDPIILAAAIAFIIATTWRLSSRRGLPPIAQLRPPLRGPPSNR